MAATPTLPTEPPHTNDVGTFVSLAAIGFVLATPTEQAAITRQMTMGGVTDMTRKFVDDLLAIKLLAPVESAGLLIQPVPMIQTFVSQLRRELVTAYYLQRSE